MVPSPLVIESPSVTTTGPEAGRSVSTRAIQYRAVNRSESASRGRPSWSPGATSPVCWAEGRNVAASAEPETRQSTTSSPPAAAACVVTGSGIGSLIAVPPAGISHVPAPRNRAGVADLRSPLPTTTASMTSGSRPNSLLSSSRAARPPRRSRTRWRTVCPVSRRGGGKNGSASSAPASAAR